MLWVIFLLSVLLNGLILHLILMPKIKGITGLIGSFVLGSFLSINFIYFIRVYLFSSLSWSSGLFFTGSVLLLFYGLRKKTIQKIPGLFLSIEKTEGILFLALLIFSLYFFSKTFSYNEQTGQFLIASNVYLDFGSHLSFIRSFSMGANFPAEVPFFANQGLIYHFMFDLYAGLLEFMGLRIDMAFNLISVISFTGLFIYLYKISQLIFPHQRIIALLVIVFSLFNSNLSFINFFLKNGINISSISAFWHNAFYLDILNGPYKGDFMVAGFWNLNTYFNQRHLIFGILFVLFIIFNLLYYHKNNNVTNAKSMILLGIMLGLLPYWHTTMFLATYLLLGAFLIFKVAKRNDLIILLIISSVVALPELLNIKFHSVNTIIFKPGFLTNQDLNLLIFFKFWFINLGVSLLTIIGGFILANKQQKRIFLAFMILFIMPNIFQFSSRFVFDDHKFFNLWIILINILSAFLIVTIYHKNLWGKIVSSVLVLLMTMSGIISLMVAKNDVYTSITDYPKNRLMSWIVKNTSPNEVFITNGEIYDPASLSGRKIIIGRSHYVYVYGGNPGIKLSQQDKILLGEDITETKRIIKENNIAYIIIYKNNFAKNPKNFNLIFLEKYFLKKYEDQNGLIFKT